MDNRTLRILEFDKVKEQIMSYAMCGLGKEQIRQLAPNLTIAEASSELAAVDEALLVILRVGGPSFGGVTDIRSSVSKSAIGGTLSSSELLAVANFISGTRQARQVLESAQTIVELPIMEQTLERLFDARRTEQEIRQAIEDDATVADGASPKLRQIRNDLRQAEARVRQVLDNLLRSQQKYLQESVVAMRGPYYCLAVRVEHKNQVRGIVRDSSASGSTVFIEPQAVVEGTERIRQLHLEEEAEIERILQVLSGIVAQIATELSDNAEIMAKLDSWFARAGYARREYATRPKLREDMVWKLEQARHPLIEREVAVPLSITLGESFDMIIVTGPNTGGKTVTLKTVGLLTLLAMSGCFIPAKEGCEVGFCDGIYADIGDEQSIEQSLSTFSSHMKNIIYTLQHVTDRSLVLLDELGAGTDPGEGAALAISILNYLQARQSKVVATSHYAELKGYAFRNEFAVNASVEFDVQTLRPTYRLLLGIPGRSNAIAIARRLGLEESILTQAQSFVATSDQRVEDLIAQMEAFRKTSEQNAAEAQVLRQDAFTLQATWQQKMDAFAEAEHRQLEQATLRARKIVEEAQAEAERVISELRQMRDRANIKDHELVELRKSLGNALPNAPQKKRTSTSGGKEQDISVGAVVRVLSLGQKGEVVEKTADGKQFTVQLGLLRMKVDASDLELLQKAVSPEKTRGVTRTGASKDVRMELDVRGETVEDALYRIDKYVDDAVVSGLRRIVIIHGKGTGALRDAVRRHMAKHRQIIGASPGSLGEGGDGVTIAEVRS